jgi:hypothetical protein
MAVALHATDGVFGDGRVRWPGQSGNQANRVGQTVKQRGALRRTNRMQRRTASRIMTGVAFIRH